MLGRTAGSRSAAGAAGTNDAARAVCTSTAVQIGKGNRRRSLMKSSCEDIPMIRRQGDKRTCAPWRLFDAGGTLIIWRSGR